MTSLSPGLTRLAAQQHGVLSREQLHKGGVTDHAMQHAVATGRWRRLHPGVYTVSPETPGWLRRASAGVAYAGPGAGLGPQASGYLARLLRQPPQIIDVWIPHRRRVAAQPGLRIVRVSGELSFAPLLPPRLRIFDVAAALAQQFDDAGELLSFLAEAAHQGLPPEVVGAELAGLSRVRHRALLTSLLADVADGIESPLEHGYHHRVERAHKLPASTLQQRQRIGRRWIRSDCRYEDFALRVELDGRLAHPGGRTDDDCWRDNHVAIHHGELTLRYRWRHVIATPCLTAAQVGGALAARGWPGQLSACGPSCAAR